MNHIELFAGCGGLSLGLESEGFKLLFANEISPMASETFAFNHLNENLDNCAKNNREPKKTFWLNSQYPKTELKKRLRENTLNIPIDTFNDIDENQESILGGIIVGSIVELNKYLRKNIKLTNLIKSGFGSGGVDLVSGGPPCQSFSMAGLREHSNQKNQLPWEFASFVELTKPKIALLENVTGILRPFTVDGEKIYAWFEVAKAFASIGYIPITLHVNAKYVGVAQNRPRFIMISIREDIFQNILSNKNSPLELSILSNSLLFYNEIKNNREPQYGLLNCWDIEKDSSLFSNTFLSPLLRYKQTDIRNVEDAIDDLRNNSNNRSSYVKEINTSFGKKFQTPNIIENCELRRNSDLVKSRFQLYQILTKIDTKIAKEVSLFLRNQENTLSKLAVKEMLRYQYRDAVNSKSQKFTTRESFENHLTTIKTKKITQKALIPKNPAPAALTIADDICHYHPDELRTLTVREMARIQSFPDSFIFKSKVTTGGKMRRFEVPQYTQVGNAVPPLLGKAIGKVITNLINRSKIE